MTPKEKAEELFTTYRFALSIKNAPLGNQKDLIAKQCALIAVAEMLDFRNRLYYNEGSLAHTYLESVKQEIEKL